MITKTKDCVSAIPASSCALANHDALGNTVSMKQNPFDQISQLVDPTGYVTTLNYDARRLSSISFPTFNQSVTYDSDNRIKQVENVLSDADNQTTQLDYDAVGNLISSLDAESNEHQFELDALDRVSKIIDPINGETLFAYDERGNLTRVTDPEGRQTAFEYNGNDQLIAEVIDVAPNQTRREYDYDGNGLLTAIRTPAGARITFTYNDAAQLTQSDVYATLVAATPDKTITFGRDDAGRLTSYNDATTSATYTYDLLDRVTSVTTDFGPFSKSYGYSYYDNGWIRTYTNPENITYTYTYHADGSLAGVAIPGEGQTSLSNYRWLAPQTVTLPGGLRLNANYDDLLRLETYEMKDAAGQLIASGDYQYDKVNNIDQIVTKADIKDYGYDDLYRLTNATFTEGAATTNLESYGYDGVGNRLTAANDPVWVYNGKNQLISHESTTYEYDLNGNRSKKTVLLPDTSTEETNYIYNPEERLVRVEDGSGSAMGEYDYDPFGLRLKKVAGGATTYFLYNGEGLAAEYDATGNLIAEYHYGPNKPWMTDPLLQKRDGTYYYYQTDHLGTPQKLLAKSGLVVWQGEYESFGEVTERVNTVTNLLRLPGQYFDAETGLHYNYFRYYDPRTGAYVYSDPIGLDGGLNAYVYVDSNPAAYIDPLGLARFGFRPLSVFEQAYNEANPPSGRSNIHIAHEQLWFDDNPNENVGFFGGDGNGAGLAVCGEAGDVRPDTGFSREDYDFVGPVYDDNLMRQALTNIRDDFDSTTYCLFGRNCQDFADSLRREYQRLANPPVCRLTRRGWRCG
jgi:RHS repeat-associated protein